MTLFTSISDENFILFAAKNYNNPQCIDVDEFYTDLARFKYIKRLLKKYANSGIIQERLLLNHLIIIYNVFGIEAANKMMFYKIEEKYWPVLKTLLIFLNYISESDKIEVPIDLNVANILRKI